MIVMTGSQDENERTVFNTEHATHEQHVVAPNAKLDNVIASLELAVEHFKAQKKIQSAMKEAEAKQKASA